MINKSSCLYYWIKMSGGYRWYYLVILVCCLVSEAADIWCLFALCSVMQTAVKFLYAGIENSENMGGLLCTLPFSRKEIFHTYIGTVLVQCIVMTIAANFRHLDQPIKVCFSVLFMLATYIVCVFLLNLPKLAAWAIAGEAILVGFILLAVVIHFFMYVTGAGEIGIGDNSIWFFVLVVVDFVLLIIAIVETVLQRKIFLRR